MGRRRKCRFVADMPEVTVFKPQGVPMSELRGVVLGLDGFEALRLVDGEGLTQEQAAERMQVSRPTLCRILGEARSQVARALSRGWAIRVEVDAEHAVAGGNGQENMTIPCRRAQAGCGRGKTQGGRSCRVREDKVAEDEARVDEARVDEVRADADRAADAAVSARAREEAS